MIHVDTGFIILSLVPASPVERRLRELIDDGHNVAVSSVAWAEFLCGPVETHQVDHVRGVLHEISPFVAADCETAAALFNRGGRRRRSLTDCMIAAVAIRNGAALATTNPRDFHRLGATLRLVEP